METNLHTYIVSDMHLSEAEEPDPRRPLWMAYKRREFFIDDEFAAFLEHIAQNATGPIELLLNGDIFDFDNVLRMPSNDGRIDWLERARGLGSEEWKSQFKMKVIIEDHPRWFEALGQFMAKGHRAVFVIGNHDVELYWPSVQRMLCDALGAPFPPNIGEEEDDDPIVFCSWFYLSGGDTYVSHGHQYDPNCVVRDPIDPLIEIRGKPRVRVPFGDLAARYMLNGMGYFNPHQSENYIMGGVAYLRFFFRYMLRTQPLLIWTWLWGAYAKLNALHVPSATNNPFRIARELWLDRAFLLLATLFLAWQVVLHINIAWPISPLWVFVPALIFMLPYLAYASSVRPTVFDTPLLSERRADLIFRITGARRVVFGHTHQPKCEQVGPITLYNGGFWSKAFADPECTIRIGEQTFVWIRPGTDGSGRIADLCEWKVAEESPVRSLCTDATSAPNAHPAHTLRDTERGLSPS
ncbi:MAG: metallophosphoesterase [Deltaproteobacteria bacterium]|nr:metallophosphoesterase [Deltaproteobacteria bacterium]